MFANNMDPEIVRKKSSMSSRISSFDLAIPIMQVVERNSLLYVSCVCFVWSLGLCVCVCLYAGTHEAND